MQKSGATMSKFIRSGVNGVLKIREFSKETGQLLYEYEDKNVITNQGINTLFLRMALSDPSNSMKFSHFAFGIDDGSQEDVAGGWGPLNPKPALKRYTSLNQLTVYEVPFGDMVFDYPNDNEFQAATLLDGKFILDTYYPEEVDLTYTSATLRFDNNTTFSYKRFPVRSLSRLIDVQVIWTFRFVNEYDFLCPVPPSEAEKRIYSAQGDIFYYTLADGSISETEVENHEDVRIVKSQPNGDVFFIKSDRRLTRMSESGSVSVDKDINISGSVTAFDVDVNNIGYLGTDSDTGTVVKLDANGSVIWSVNLSDNDGRTKTVSSVWVINNSRVAVVTKDEDFSPGSSGNMIHVISAVDGTVIYSNTPINSEGRTGHFDFISSSGGEFFAIQKPAQSGDNSSLIKLAFDLTELSRIAISSEVKSIFADHNNDILVGYDNGNGSSLARYDADLNFIWKHDGDGDGYVHIGVDRDAKVFAATSERIDMMDSDLSLIATTSFSGALSMSVVGEKWSYFS